MFCTYLADMSETLYSKEHDKRYNERGETDGTGCLTLKCPFLNGSEG